MPTPSIRRIIMGVLINQEGAIMASFPGGVWPRLPQAGNGMYATPGAFYTAADGPEKAGKLKNTISVLDGGDDPSPGGLGQRGFVAYPLVRAWVTANLAGEELAEQLGERLHARFNRGVSYPRGDAAGSMLELVTLERQPFSDGDDFGYPGTMFTTWRIQGTFVRPAIT